MNQPDRCEQCGRALPSNGVATVCLACHSPAPTARATSIPTPTDRPPVRCERCGRPLPNNGYTACSVCDAPVSTPRGASNTNASHHQHTEDPAIRCERCGRRLSAANAHGCPACGAALRPESVAALTRPRRPSTEPRAANPDTARERYVDAFVQSDGYREPFDLFDREGGYVFTFHWGAALLDSVLGPVWFIYRKLYLWAVGLLFANGLLVMLLPPNPDGLDGTTAVRAIANGLLHGSLAYYAYWLKTKEAVRTEQRKSTNETEVLKALSRQGGTNPVAAVAFALLLLVGSFLFGLIMALESIGLI